MVVHARIVKYRVRLGVRTLGSTPGQGIWVLSLLWDPLTVLFLYGCQYTLSVIPSVCDRRIFFPAHVSNPRDPASISGILDICHQRWTPDVSQIAVIRCTPWWCIGRTCTEFIEGMASLICRRDRVQYHSCRPPPTAATFYLGSWGFPSAYSSGCVFGPSCSQTG
jgi:hypothetical protein